MLKPSVILLKSGWEGLEEEAAGWEGLEEEAPHTQEWMMMAQWHLRLFLAHLPTGPHLICLTFSSSPEGNHF